MARKPSFTKTAGLIFRCVITSLYKGLSVRPYIHISIFWSIRRSTSHHLRSSHYGSNLSKIDSCEPRLCMMHVGLFSALTLLHLWTNLCAPWSRAEQSGVQHIGTEWSAAEWAYEWANDFFRLCVVFGLFRIMEKEKMKNTNCQTWVSGSSRCNCTTCRGQYAPLPPPLKKRAGGQKCRKSKSGTDGQTDKQWLIHA